MEQPAVTPPAEHDAVQVTVIIKALNEERRIAAAISSSLAALARLSGRGQVILADSLSTDRTVEIACRYPVTIVQLTDPRDRSCGIGAQLGMVAAEGEYLYVLDGDMELDADFLPVALARLEADPGLGGVAGVVQEMHVANEVFRRRQQSGDTVKPGSGLVCLNMGGLYRRTAVEATGYLTNRNLHAFEEFELGIRLIAAGWRLERLDKTSVRHYGHTEGTYSLLWRRWRTRHAWGHGELLRQALHGRHLGLALRHLRLYHVAAFVLLAWIGLMIAAILLPPLPALATVVGFWLAMFGVMAVRKRSMAAALYSIAAWHVGAAGLLVGLMQRPRSAPDAPIYHRQLQ
jgi:GT2 family glycosyltransferase